MSKNIQYLSENKMWVLPYLLGNSCVAKAARVSPKQIYRGIHESKAFRDELRFRQMAVADAAKMQGSEPYIGCECAQRGNKTGNLAGGKTNG